MYKIMVVDDDPVSLAICKALLSADYEVVLMKSSLHALGHLREQSKPNLILLDMMMPGMDGMGMLKNLREDEQNSDIPVLFMTSLGVDQMSLDNVQDGTIDFIQKPVAAKLLKMKILHQIYVAELRKENLALKKKLELISKIL